MAGMPMISQTSISPAERTHRHGLFQKITSIQSAAFQAQYAGRDLAAGLITGVMAIPLSVGIAMMSEYPIKVGLATVAFACLIGCPGIAAGLAPVLAMGVASFGMENMAFVIFLTAVMQAII
jgi:MFS superfamily sulfate permease-like transporter